MTITRTLKSNRRYASFQVNLSRDPHPTCIVGTSRSEVFELSSYTRLVKQAKREILRLVKELASRTGVEPVSPP